MRNNSLDKMFVQIKAALTLCLLVGAVSSSSAGTSIAVNFSGRGVGGNATAGAFLATTETAGVVPQLHWNNIDIQGNPPFANVTTLGLLDSGYNFTGVRLIFDASDSWSSGGGTSTPDEKLMKGIVKANPDPDTAPINNTDRMLFVITNVPAGTYTVNVYLMENDINCAALGGTSTNCAEAEVTLGATTYYVEQEGVFTGTYVKATSTTPGTYTDANYAEFLNVIPVGNTITITAKKRIANPQLTDGIGVAGIQLLQVSGSAYPANTDTCAITANPASTLVVEGGSATFTVGSSGPCKFQWTKNGTNLVGATGSTLIYTPVLADNNALFRAIVYNNVVTNTSTAATLTVDANTPPTLTQGFMRVEQFQNLGGDTGSGGVADLKTNLNSNGDPLTTPTLSYYVGGANVPQTSPDVDNFGDRIWGWVKPDVTGTYRFFLRSDDASELYINTTAAAGSGTNALPNPQTAFPDAFYYLADGAGFAEPPAARTSDPFALQAGKLYGVVILLKCAGGTDLAQLAWRLDSDTTPAGNLRPIPGPNVYTMASPAGQRATITTQPQSITVVQGRKGTFNVGVTTTPTPGAYSVQWLSNNVIIQGASGNTYTTPQVALSDNNTQIKARALTLVGTLDSSIAILTVIPDTNPPTATAGSITKSDGTIEVGFSFDEPINPASLVSGNFSVLGHASTFKLATNSYNTYQGVVLDPSGLSPGNTYTARVQNVSDPYGNVMPLTDVPFVVSPVRWGESGVPIRPGQIIPQGATGFDVLNGGRKEWDSYDEITMAYVKKTNDFDVQVQVVFAEPGSQWTRVGLQARNSLDAGVASTNGTGLGEHSAYAQTHVNPNQSIGSAGVWPASDPIQPGNPGANNSHEQNTRLTKAASTTGWQTNNAGTPDYPNVWLRLKRVGTNIIGYASTDGHNWVGQGIVSLTDQQADMFVGPSLSMESGNIWGASPGNGFDVWGPTDPACVNGCTFDPTYDRLILAQFRNFVDVASISTLSIAIVGGQPTITFSGALQRSSSVSGPYVDVLGATSPYTVPPGPSTGFFRARGTITPQ